MGRTFSLRSEGRQGVLRAFDRVLTLIRTLLQTVSLRLSPCLRVSPLTCLLPQPKMCAKWPIPHL